ncbi:MAG: hypothetical protein ACP5G7_02330 [Anaerolineae bacterium]
MSQVRHGRRRWLALGLAVCVTLAAAPSDLGQRISAIAAPYRFDATHWMARQLLLPRQAESLPDNETPSHYVQRYLGINAEMDALERQRDAALASNPQDSQRADAVAELTRAMDDLRRVQRAMRPNVERILAIQIRDALSELGIRNPADPWARLPFRFPPIAFRLESPPQLLVVSPRERIESIQEIMLEQDLDLATALNLEEQVEELGLSALVTDIGGFGGTYPTFVAESASLRWTIETATEEWLHQYLAFTPLGARYVLDLLGLCPDYEIARINETVAGMVSQEVADVVLMQSYEKEGAPVLPTAGEGLADEGFDYTGFMRETRVQVDRLLEAGRIEEAEAYMETRRRELVRHGYAIRKLNQAYFAFHGTYTYGPAAVDPIYEEIKLLRAQSPDLRAFLTTAAKLKSRAELRALLELPPPQQALREESSWRSLLSDLARAPTRS